MEAEKATLLGAAHAGDLGKHNAAFLAKGAIRCAEDRGHGTGHGMPRAICPQHYIEGK